MGTVTAAPSAADLAAIGGEFATIFITSGRVSGEFLALKVRYFWPHQVS